MRGAGRLERVRTAVTTRLAHRAGSIINTTARVTIYSCRGL